MLFRAIKRCRSHFQIAAQLPDLEFERSSCCENSCFGHTFHQFICMDAFEFHNRVSSPTMDWFQRKCHVHTPGIFLS